MDTSEEDRCAMIAEIVNKTLLETNGPPTYEIGYKIRGRAMRDIWIIATHK